MLNENLDSFFNDFGVYVEWNTKTFQGLLEMPDELIGGGIGVSTSYSLIAKTEDVAGMDTDESITVDGLAYKTRNAFKIDDGKMTKIVLTKV